jgi:hypothetical protein
MRRSQHFAAEVAGREETLQRSQNAAGAENKRGLFVIGMHRSGTSVATRLINLIGLPVGLARDLMAPDDRNPKGFWESQTLTDTNDEILRRLGGNATAPPPEPIDWTSDPRLDTVRVRAVAAFRTIHPSPQWLWKDPRLCLTLPFWRQVLPEPIACVYVYRNPEAIHRSLSKTNAFDKWLSLALWERYVRDAIKNMTGLPVLVTSFEEILAGPMAWCDTVRSFLDRLGFDTVRPSSEQVHGFLDIQLLHSSAHSAWDDTDALTAQRELDAIVRDLIGEHDRFTAPALPGPAGWSQALLDWQCRWQHENRARHRQTSRLRRDVSAVNTALARSKAALATVTASKSWRLTAPVRRASLALKNFRTLAASRVKRSDRRHNPVARARTRP